MDINSNIAVDFMNGSQAKKKLFERYMLIYTGSHEKVLDCFRVDY